MKTVIALIKGSFRQNKAFIGRRVVRTTLSALVVISLVSACASNGQVGQASDENTPIPVYPQQSWHLSELVNETRSASASRTVSTLLQTHLRARGVSSESSLQEPEGLQVEGEVLRWNYQNGAALRPHIEMRIAVRDITKNVVIRSDTFSELGSRSESLIMLADRLLADYVKALPLDRRPDPMKGIVASKASAGYPSATGATPELPGALLGVRSLAEKPVEAGLFTTVDGVASLAGRSVAFYYGATPAVDELSQFDRIILEPDNINTDQLNKLTAQGAVAYAYLSVGEVGKHRAYASDLNPDWIMGSNPAWQSAVLDLANPDLRNFLVNRVGELVSRGYQGVFLDTMDSFNIVAKTPEQQRVQRAGLVELVAQFATTFPQLSIISNRGFEVLDDISKHVDAVVAESLYSGWNNEKQQYVEIPDDDRQWLISKLDHAATKLDLEVIVVDYVPPAMREKARYVAKRIAQHGFIPWVANPELDYLGIGALEVIPRKVLMLYDGNLEGVLKDSFVHRYIAMPVEYLGYVPEYHDVSSEPLPQGVLKGRYAGIVTWTAEPFTSAQFRPWLIKQMQDRVPVAFLGAPPLTIGSTLASLMGVSSTAIPEARSARVVLSDDMIKPERTLSPRVSGFSHALKSENPDNRVHMRYGDDRDTVADVVVTGSFGGYAFTPGVVQDGLDYGSYWIVDPFRFIETALQLPRVPQPDVTTENGRRLWLAHIDGDALPSWAEMPGRRLGAEVIYDQILSKYKLPHTISVVEGEMTGLRQVFDRRNRMFDIARRTFKLDHVELASHTYSHPFFWSRLSQHLKSGRFNLPIPGYSYSAEREVAGSIDFINKNLAPPGKKVEVMLWSGDALPGEEDLAVVKRLGIVNMNGGFTAITRNKPTATLVTAMARPVGEQLQVYAPIMNENVYTDDWLGPFDGFREVIDTLQMTDKPRRLKPINIYYHFYSGTKLSAMKALREVYDWTIKQEIFPVYVSDYARKVPDYRSAGVARYLDGRWSLSGLGNIRSLRVLGDATYPQFSKSRGITGARKLHDAIYFHTDGSDKVAFKTSNGPSRYPHLVSSNGRVRHWRVSNGELAFRISGEVPVSVELGGSLSTACALSTDAGMLRSEPQRDGSLRFTFTQKDTGNVTLNCPA